MLSPNSNWFPGECPASRTTDNHYYVPTEYLWFLLRSLQVDIEVAIKLPLSSAFSAPCAPTTNIEASSVCPGTPLTATLQPTNLLWLNGL